MIITILVAILLFGFIIFIHELGHFLTARYFNVTVDEFSIGMGPKIISKKSKGILYSLRALPIGGYVSMVGEDEYSEDPNALHNKPKWQRFLILSSGAFMNLILGFIVILICVTFSGNIYSNTIERFNVVDESGSYVTEYNGLRIGDRIIAVNGERINVRYDYVFTAMRSVDKECTITVLRNGKIEFVENFIFPTAYENGIVIGNPSFFFPELKNKTFYNIVHETFFQTVSVIKMVVYSIVDIISGNFTPEAVSGPVGVVSQIHETAKIGVTPLFFLFSMITINIGVFNLLPFPALDGGRILFLLVELIIRRPINKKIESIINFAGLAILFSLMILITFKDIVSLFT